MIVLVTSDSPSGRGGRDDDERGVTTVTLPDAATAGSRFVVVRRMDNRGRVVVRPATGTLVGGALDDAVVLERRFDQVVLASDGVTWVIFDGSGARYGR